MASRSTLIRAKSIDDARVMLRSLPPKEPDPVPRKEAFQAIRTEIEAAQAGGYDLQEILRHLAKIDPALGAVSPAMARSYLRDDGINAKPRTTRRSEARADAPEVPEVPEVPKVLPPLAVPASRSPHRKPRRFAGLIEEV